MATKIDASWINNLYTALNTTLPGKGFSMTGTIPSGTVTRTSRVNASTVTSLITSLNNQQSNEFFKLIKNSQWPINTTTPRVAVRSIIDEDTKLSIDEKINEMLSMYANYGKTSYTTYVHYSHYNKSGDSVNTPTGNSVNTGDAVSRTDTCSRCNNLGNSTCSRDGNAGNSTCSRDGNAGNSTCSRDGNAGNSTCSRDGDKTGNSNVGRTCANNNGFKSHKAFTNKSDNRDANTCTDRDVTCNDCTNTRDTNNSYFSTESNVRGNSVNSGDGKSTGNRVNSGNGQVTGDRVNSGNGKVTGDRVNSGNSVVTGDNVNTGNPNTYNSTCDKCANLSFTHQSNNTNTCTTNVNTAEKSNHTKNPAPFSN